MGVTKASRRRKQRRIDVPHLSTMNETKHLVDLSAELLVEE